MARSHDLCRARRLSQWLLCVAPTAGELAQHREPRASARHPPNSCREWRVLWRAAYLCGAAGCRPADRTTPYRPPDAACRPARAGGDPAPCSHDRQPARLPDRAEQAAQELHRDRAEPGMARGPDLHPDRRRLALSCGADRHAHPQGRGLEHARDPSWLDRTRSTRHGHQTPAPGAGVRRRSRTHGDAMAHSSIRIAAFNTRPTSIAKPLPQRR